MDSVRKFDVITIGSATQDVFVRSELGQIISIRDALHEKELLGFEYGGKINVDRVEFTTGGGSSNVACALAKLGLSVAFLGKLGKDQAGRNVIGEMEGLGADVSNYMTSDEHCTGYSVIISSFEGDRTVLAYRGANADITEKEFPWEIIGAAKWAYLTSLRGMSVTIIEKVFSECRKNKVKLAWNPGSQQLAQGHEALRKYLKQAEIVFLNKDEAARLTGIEPERRYIDHERCNLCEDCIAACPQAIFRRDGDSIRTIHEDTCTKCGDCIGACSEKAVIMEPWAWNVSGIFEKLSDIGLAVITDGGNGVQVSDGKTVHMFPAFKANVVDTLGAGDGFGAGFLAGYISSKGDIEKAIQLGTANGASVSEHIGAKKGQLMRDAAEKFDAERISDYHFMRKLELANL
ncbi:MAG: carbohydrate kinase family protein [Planctomycetota bacterium]|jgi:sugar/nucleoside kinase (ribokinase family)